MKITVFTSNQPRHLRLIQKLSEVATEVFAIVESNTVFPGSVSDFFSKSDVMQTYFSNVIEAESKLCGQLHFSPRNVRTLSLKSGDLSGLSRSILEEALSSDYFVVFGASYIKGWLASELEQRGAFNIHMGISPYYRGSSCNFWAMFDENPGLVGATIHKLTTGLDSGPMIRHVRPVYSGQSPFEFTMSAVTSAQDTLVQMLSDGSISSFEPIMQDKSLQIRYSKNQEFTDEVAKEFLSRDFKLSPITTQLQATLNISLIE